MSEAQRKAKALAELTDGLTKAHAEGQGVWQTQTFNWSQIPKIMRGVASGDRKCRELAQIVRTIKASIHNPPEGQGKPLLCFTCDAKFTPNSKAPEAFIVLRGANPDGRSVVAQVLCLECDRHPDRDKRTMDQIRDGMISDLREIHVREPGHA